MNSTTKDFEDICVNISIANFRDTIDEYSLKNANPVLTTIACQSMGNKLPINWLSSDLASCLNR
jgi:hypothetical protein